MKGKIKKLVGGKIIIRVPDPAEETPRKTLPTKPPPATVKTVVF